MYVSDIVVASDTFARPNDTTTYAAGDAVSDSTSTPTPLTFAGVAHRQGRGGILQAVHVILGAYTAAGSPGSLSGHLMLFSEAPAAAGFDDNAATAITDAELENVVAVVAFDLDNGSPGTASAGDSGSQMVTVGNLGIPFRCAADDTDLYGVLVASNAYVPVAQQDITVKIVVERETRV